jgi:hypothetical protein
MKYINIFINDKPYGQIFDILYKTMTVMKNDKGENYNPPPLLSNNRWLDKEGLLGVQGKTWKIAVWLNEREGKRMASIGIAEAEDKYIDAKPFNKEEEVPW